jgi:DNA invertase Pin-like site-specific DNA recombinase
VKAGSGDAIVCWHVDRLTRFPRELEDVIDLADRFGVELATVTERWQASRSPASAGIPRIYLLSVVKCIR